MTAYGRADKDHSLGHCSLSIQSVNRKSLDFQFVLPKELAFLEVDFRKQIASRLSRGYLTIQMELLPSQQSLSSIVHNTALAKKYVKSWHSLAEVIGIPFNPEAFWHYLSLQEGIFQVVHPLPQQEEIRKIVFDLVNRAIDDLIRMKEAEGQHIASDLLTRLTMIEKCVAEVRERAPDVKDRYRQKLVERMQEIDLPQEIKEEAILKEAVLYAEKSDITEEIVRLDSHSQQFRQVLEGGEEVMGERLDFLVQEMHREWTTIGAKSPDQQVVRIGIDAKVELKRMREQIQNVE